MTVGRAGETVPLQARPRVLAARSQPPPPGRSGRQTRTLDDAPPNRAQRFSSGAALRLNLAPVVRNFLVVQMPHPRYVGRVPLTLRPGYRLFLGLECLEDAIPLLLDDIVHDSGPFPSAFRTGLNVNCRHEFSPGKVLIDRARIAQSQGLQQWPESVAPPPALSSADRGG